MALRRFESIVLPDTLSIKVIHVKSIVSLSILTCNIYKTITQELLYAL